MKALILLLYVGILFGTNMKAQNVQLEFYAEEPTSVYLFEPLDNAYNYQYATDTLYLKPKLKIEYNIQVADFQYTRIDIPKLGQFVLPLIKDNKIQLKIGKDKVTFSGDNAAGLIYFNNEFIKKGLAAHIENIDTIVNRLRKSNSYSDTYRLCLSEMTRDIREKIDSLLITNQISDRFAEVFRTNIDYAFLFWIINQYKILQKEIPQDSTDIELAIDNLYSSYSINNPDILLHSYASSYVSSYFERKASKKDTGFGPYSYFSVSPSYVLLPCIGRALLVDLLYGIESFDHEKVYAYLATNFPDSDYVRILKSSFVNVQPDEDISTSDSIEYITSTVLRLEDLLKQEQFKEKYILIDMWATWCTPCKLEFQYASVIDDVLKRHTNLRLLYLSIDEERFIKHWEKTINKLNLKGVHLRVDNPTLYQDVEEKIYSKGKVTIPRYVLLSPEGKIVDSNLPRPSSQSKFKETLNDLME